MSLRRAPDLVEFGTIPASAWTSGALPQRSLMQTHDWLSAAAETYGQGQHTLALLPGGLADPRGLALLGRARAGGLRLLGSIDIGESVELLWRDSDALEELARGLTRLGVAVELGHYPNGLDFAAKLRRVQGQRGMTVARALPQRAAPCLPLDDSWQDPLRHFGAKRRQRFRRKWRKAERFGPIAVEIAAPSEVDLDRQFDRGIAIEARSWKGRAGSALMHDERQAAFFRDFGRRMAAKGQLRLCFLTIGGADAAVEYAVVWQNRFWSIKLGYDDAFAEFSPGEALRLELVRHSAEKGYDAFEFCGKEADWTKGWTDRATEIAALRIYPFTLAGLGKLAYDGCEIGRRRLRAAKSP